jgi:hypothetical protein
MRREDQKSLRGKHKRQQKGRRKVVRREEWQEGLKRLPCWTLERRR